VRYTWNIDRLRQPGGHSQRCKEKEHGEARGQRSDLVRSHLHLVALEKKKARTNRAGL
jgi:hypothetical protein